MVDEAQQAKPSSYLVRLQVRIGKRFSTDADRLDATVLGRSVSIKSRSGSLSETDWIVLEARGFSSEEDAHEFGQRLRLLATIAGLCAHLGIDAGRDSTLGSFSEHAIALRKTGLAHDVRIPPEKHGILVLPDDGKSLFMYANVTMSVSSDPANLMEALETLLDCSTSFDVGRYPERLVNALKLLNQAMIAEDSRGKIVLAIAAVEGLILNHDWSDRQQEWFHNTIAILEKADDRELREIADGLQRMYRISLRQGVFRLLKENGLEDYKPHWDDLYGKRSGLLHGTKVLNKRETHRLANDIVKLCVTIVLIILRNRGIVLPKIAAVHFDPALFTNGLGAG